MRIVLKTGLGKRISDLRQDHDMTQDDLADRIGVTGSTIQRWETGQTKIDPDGLLKLSKEFNVSVDWLLMGVGTENLAFSRETGLSETSINEFKNNKKLSTAVNYLTNVGCAELITTVAQAAGLDRRRT